MARAINVPPSHGTRHCSPVEQGICRIKMVPQRSRHRAIPEQAGHPVRLDGAPLGFISDLQAIVLRSGDDPQANLRIELDRIGLSGASSFPLVAGNPYPGFNAFDREHASVYFGRDDEIRDAIARLTHSRGTNTHRLTVITGASGAGKSSLLKAGVIPRLAKNPKEWIIWETYPTRRHLPISPDKSVPAASNPPGGSGGRAWHDVRMRRNYAAENASQTRRPGDSERATVPGRSRWPGVHSSTAYLRLGKLCFATFRIGPSTACRGSRVFAIGPRV